jgi:four helix bundle protein
MASSVKELKLWQEAVTLGAEILRAVRQHSRRESRGFTDRLILSASQLAVMISDGHRKRTPLEQLHYFERAASILSSLEADLLMARQAGLFSENTSAGLTQRQTVVGRLLFGYVSYVERQAAADEAEASTAAAAAAVRESVDQVNGA